MGSVSPPSPVSGPVNEPSRSFDSSRMDATDVRAPQLWRRPHAKIYGYNQDFSANYYSPMLNYVQTKSRQGIFFQKPEEKIHLPDGAELVMRNPEERNESSTSPFYLDSFLVGAFSQQIREVNKDTVHTQNRMLRGSRDNTVLHPKLTATMLRNHYVKELHQLKARGPIYT